MSTFDGLQTGAAALARAITERGRVEGRLVKVDDFLNHRVDPELMDAIGRDIAARWSVEAPTVVLTAEASGIAPALTAAAHLGVPMVYAKKYPRAAGTERPSFVREVSSPTKGDAYRIEVTRRLLPASSVVLVVDDFLSGGRTAEALGDIVLEAGAALLGFAFVIAKSFEPGGDLLASRGWEVDALVHITSIDDELTLEMTSGRGHARG